MEGCKTGLVVTSTINHATPACYAAHVADHNSYKKIAEHEIGYSHPLGPQVDILLGGGCCYSKPESDPTSCREAEIDLFGYAEEKGYRVVQDRKAFLMSWGRDPRRRLLCLTLVSSTMVGAAHSQTVARLTTSQIR